MGIPGIAPVSGFHDVVPPDASGRLVWLPIPIGPVAIVLEAFVFPSATTDHYVVVSDFAVLFLRPKSFIRNVVGVHFCYFNVDVAQICIPCISLGTRGTDIDSRP